MKTNMKSNTSYFNSNFNSGSSQVKFKGNFSKVDSSTDLDLDLLLIFDGGDVDGYEKDLQDYIQATSRD